MTCCAVPQLNRQHYKEGKGEMSEGEKVSGE